ncbi:class A beta-lactamase [Agrobacterium cavarae]|uniref:class A beta-lactamase n=1 Tax=Agrobacterium cavarae TaxID=2528239 RepID=UPI003FCF974C
MSLSAFKPQLTISGRRYNMLKPLIISFIAAAWPVAQVSAADDPIALAAIAAEKGLVARVGVAAYDYGTQSEWLYRADERFPMASTSKTLVCAALLQAGPKLLEKQITISAGDVQDYAPVTKTMIGHGMTGSELCTITMRTSDNTAVNKVLELLKGPQEVTFLRGIGDTVSRLDRNEPSLNEGKPGDLLDTTTPRAMMDTMRKLVRGDALGSEARSILTGWLKANEVGGPLLRAGLPKDWIVGDRTGAGGFGTRGVASVIWPPKRPPLVAVVYVTETTASMDARNAAIASIGTAIADSVK